MTIEAMPQLFRPVSVVAAVRQLPQLLPHHHPVVAANAQPVTESGSCRLLNSILEAVLHLVVAAVRQLPKLLPHLDCLLTHELNRRDVAVSGGLGKLLVKVLILKVAVLLQATAAEKQHKDQQQ
jgi:hypothetical protein